MATTIKEPCPRCKGEGFIEIEIPRGRYNKSGGYWEPAYREETCENCEGEGWVEMEEWEFVEGVGLRPKSERLGKVVGQADIKINTEPQGTFQNKEIAALHKIIAELEKEVRDLERKVHNLSASHD